MIKTKVAFLEGRLSSSQSKQLKKYSKSSDWLEKKPAKSHFCFDHVNRLFITAMVLPPTQARIHNSPTISLSSAQLFNADYCRLFSM